MGKIFCLMGKSSSGKDTIFKALITDEDLRLRPVVSYTTRPIRQNEQHGFEYYFINREQLEQYEATDHIIEKRDYTTVNGLWSYCTIDDGQIDLTSFESYILIVTLEAYENLQRYFGKEYVVPLYIHVDDGIRLTRALQREQTQHSPNYEEVCRRFLADGIDFESAKLKSAGIIKQYCNADFNQCVHAIKRAIRDEMGRVV